MTLPPYVMKMIRPFVPLFRQPTSLGNLLQLGNDVDNGGPPLAEYAALHWVDHVQFGDVAFHVKNGMRRLFDLAKTDFTAWLRLHDIDDGWTV